MHQKMRFLITLTYIAFGAVNNVVKANIFKTPTSSRIIGPIDCTLYMITSLVVDPEKQEEHKPDRICETDGNAADGSGGIAYILEGLDEAFYENVEFGETRVSIKNARITDQTLTVLPDERGNPSISILKGSNMHARRPPFVGTSTLLVVYVVPPDVKNDAVSYEQMGDKVFGTGSDPSNARSQFLACSKGQLEYIPACSREEDSCHNDTDFVNGVLKVPITQNARNVNYRTVVEYSKRAAIELLSLKGLSMSNFTQVMYVYPSEVLSPTAAAQLAGTNSFFTDDSASIMGFQVHEFGHNLGFHHSGYGTEAVTDGSCLMSYMALGDHEPQVCFNGAKSWASTWYNDDSMIVNVLNMDSFRGELVGVGDWALNKFTSGEHHVVIKIPDPSNVLDYYVIFNRKIGPNKGVDFFPDQVHVTTGKLKKESWHKAHLEAGGVYTVNNFGGTPHELRVVVCDINITNNGPSTASVLIYLAPANSGYGGVRLWTRNLYTPEHIWAVYDLSFYPNNDCSGEKIQPQGTIIDSNHYNSYPPQNAFDENDSSAWGGFHSDYTIWIGMTFTESQPIKCVSFLDDDVKYAKQVTVQVSYGCSNTWTNVVEVDGIAGVRQNIPLGPATEAPTKSPTTSPTKSPTKFPTEAPTKTPTKAPTTSPTKSPTQFPTESMAPTYSVYGGVRLWAHSSNIPKSMWVVCDLSFYQNDNCSGEKLQPQGTIIESDHWNSYSPQNAFDESNSSCWAGHPSDNTFWIGMSFIESQHIKCVSFLDATNSYAKQVTVQVFNIFSNSWTNVVEVDGIAGVRQNISLGPTTPSEGPTKTPTMEPMNEPSKVPTYAPTKERTEEPTKFPTETPTKKPTMAPTKTPSKEPTKEPTKFPTETPTKKPTIAPTKTPSKEPTKEPTKFPTDTPTKKPTHAPTKTPSKEPTEEPTKFPTETPTKKPTITPTKTPSKEPTMKPTEKPTNQPTVSFCTDGTKWYHKKKKNNCASILKVKKRALKNHCMKADKHGKKAREACPIACKEKKTCTKPKCWKNGDWEPKKNDEKFRVCSDLQGMKKNKMKKYCQRVGSDKVTDEIQVFAYEVCGKCGYCDEKKKMSIFD